MMVVQIKNKIRQSNTTLFQKECNIIWLRVSIHTESSSGNRTESLKESSSSNSLWHTLVRSH